MKFAFEAGRTDVTVDVFIQNASVTNGAGLTGLTFETSGLACYYRRVPAGEATAITLATQTVTGAHADGGFVEVDGTNMPGQYRLDLPDAVCAAGAPSVSVMLKGAANMAPVPLEIQLDPVPANVAEWLGSVPNALVSGRVPVRTEVLADDVITDTSIAAGALTAAKAAAGFFDAVWSVSTRTLTALGASLVQEVWDRATSALTTAGSVGKLLADALTGHSPQSGDAFTRLGAPASASIAADIQTRSSHTATDVWAVADRTLTSFGTLVADVAAAVWGAATRTLTTIAGLTGYTAPDNAGIAAAQAAAEDAQAVTAKLDTALELDGAVYRYTANALEQAPTGGGGGTADWTTGEKEQIRSALGIDGDKVPAAGGQLQDTAAEATVLAVKAQTDALPVDPASEATVLAVKAKTDALPADPASEATVADRLAASAYTAPDNAGISTANANLALIKTSTDALPASPAGQEKLDTLEERLTAARATNLDNLDALISSRSTFSASSEQVIPIDVDGLTHEQAMMFLMAILGNVTVPAGSSVAFKRRDGTTTIATITYGVTDGERVASELVF